MINAKSPYFAAFLLMSLFCANALHAYPIWVKIINPRAHSLYIENEREGIRIKIPSGGEREFKVAARDNDWRVRYATGILGAANQYILDQELSNFIEVKCKDCIGDHWNTRTVKYATLRLDEVPGIAQSSYTLTVVEIRDLEIAYDSQDCALNPNEMLLRLIPIASTFNLMGAEDLAQKMCLYRSRKSTE